MSFAGATTSFEPFIKTVTDSPSIAILADYDGTIAPFQIDRQSATPYAGIPELLARLASQGARVAMVSGRPAHDVQRLLGIPSIEVWGCHGAERLLPTGEYIATESPATNLSLILEALEREQLSREVELKPFSVAVHWRGLPSQEASELRFAAIRAIRSLSLPNYGLFEFDGGMEFRPLNISKAIAVRQVRQELPSHRIVYLGDDFTDEDAFCALGEDDLAVLVRHEYRTTAAQLWLKPPEELIAFLENIAFAMGGVQ
jgi:trehalose 6-phosphate phosphatase